jgi:hypothetical protein
MLKFIFWVLSSLIVTAIFSQNSTPDCSLFKMGDFVYKDSSGITWDLKRINKYQTERNEQTGLFIKHKIDWVSNCEYKLTQIWSNNKERRKQNRAWLVYKIISSTGYSYEYTCSCSDGKKISGVVVKLDN